MLIELLLAVQTAAVTPAEMEHLPPGELGRRLLAAPPGPIVEAFLYNDSPAPSAPGAPVVQRVMMYEAAREGGDPDFCEKVRYLVRLRPVRPGPDGRLPPSTTATVTPTTLYRLRSPASANPCEGRGGDFLSVSDHAAAAVFSSIRELAKAQADPAATRDTVGSVDDELGRDGVPAPGRSGPITDWREAFKAFPTTRINSYQFGRDANGFTVSFRAEAWLIELTSRNGGGYQRIALRRLVPSPP